MLVFTTQRSVGTEALGTAASPPPLTHPPINSPSIRCSYSLLLFVPLLFFISSLLLTSSRLLMSLFHNSSSLLLTPLLLSSSSLLPLSGSSWIMENLQGVFSAAFLMLPFLATSLAPPGRPPPVTPPFAGSPSWVAALGLPSLGVCRPSNRLKSCRLEVV